MEPTFKTSFIPKESLKAASPVRNIGRTRGRFGVATALTFAIFLITMAVAGALFLYGLFLQKSNTDKKASLERSSAAFQPALIEQLSRLDTRIDTATSLLGSHIAPSAILTVFQQLTVSAIQYSGFTYKVADAGASVRMAGRAKSFNSVAYQADRLGENPAIKNPVISDIRLDGNGDVLFNLTVTFDKSVLAYIPDATQVTTPVSNISGATTTDSGTVPQQGPPNRPIPLSP